MQDSAKRETVFVLWVSHTFNSNVHVVHTQLLVTFFYTLCKKPVLQGIEKESTNPIVNSLSIFSSFFWNGVLTENLKLLFLYSYSCGGGHCYFSKSIFLALMVSYSFFVFSFFYINFFFIVFISDSFYRLLQTENKLFNSILRFKWQCTNLFFILTLFKQPFYCPGLVICSTYILIKIKR